MEEVKLTASQKKLRRCFLKLENELGREPTAAELGRALDVSRWAIHSAMTWLVQKGVFEYRGVPGPWKFTKKGRDM